MSSIFDAVTAALASFLGTDSTSAGYILGFIVICLLLVVVTWALGEHSKGMAILVPIGIGIVFVALVGWWPLWTIVFIAIVVAMVVLNPFESSGSVG